MEISPKWQAIVWGVMKLCVVNGFSLTVPSDTRRASGRAGLTVCITVLQRRPCQDFAPVLVFISSACALAVMSIVASASCGDLSILVVSKRDNVSAAYCLMQVQWTTSKSKSNCRTCHLARFAVPSVIFCIQRSVSWSVRIINGYLSRYSLQSKTAHMTVRHSICVLSYACSALFKIRDQYPRAFAGPSGCYWVGNTGFDCHTRWCQTYNVRSILLVMVSDGKVVAALACLEHLFQARLVFQSETAGLFPACSWTVCLYVRNLVQTFKTRCRISNNSVQSLLWNVTVCKTRPSLSSTWQVCQDVLPDPIYRYGLLKRSISSVLLIRQLLTVVPIQYLCCLDVFGRT